MVVCANVHGKVLSKSFVVGTENYQCRFRRLSSDGMHVCALHKTSQQRQCKMILEKVPNIIANGIRSKKNDSAIFP